MNHRQAPDGTVRDRPPLCQRPPRRVRGITIAETVAAVALLAIAITVSMRVVGWIASERRAAEQRIWALQEATNALESLQARPPEQLTPDSLRSHPPVLGDDAQAILPGGRLVVTVREEPGPPVARWVQVAVLWKDRGGGSVTPVRLSTWVYPGKEQPKP